MQTLPSPFARPKYTHLITTLTAGIDTVKHKLDVAVHEGSARWQVDNTLPGWRSVAPGLSRASEG
jgi:hypothetical protein